MNRGWASATPAIIPSLRTAGVYNPPLSSPAAPHLWELRIFRTYFPGLWPRRVPGSKSWGQVLSQDFSWDTSQWVHKKCVFSRCENQSKNCRPSFDTQQNSENDDTSPSLEHDNSKKIRWGEYLDFFGDETWEDLARHRSGEIVLDTPVVDSGWMVAIKGP